MRNQPGDVLEINDGNPCVSSANKLGDYVVDAVIIKPIHFISAAPKTTPINVFISVFPVVDNLDKSR